MATKAEAVARLVRDALDTRYPGVLIELTIDEPNTLRIVYHEIHNERPRVLGMIRELEPDHTPQQLADEIVEREIGEPLGTLDAELAEEDGIWWHHGNRPEWRYY